MYFSSFSPVELWRNGVSETETAKGSTRAINASTEEIWLVGESISSNGPFKISPL